MDFLPPETQNSVHISLLTLTRIRQTTKKISSPSPHPPSHPLMFCYQEEGTSVSLCLKLPLNEFLNKPIKCGEASLSDLPVIPHQNNYPERLHSIRSSKAFSRTAGSARRGFTLLLSAVARERRSVSREMPPCTTITLWSITVANGSQRYTSSSSRRIRGPCGPCQRGMRKVLFIRGIGVWLGSDCIWEMLK